ncbi:MAG: tetratricopeptide repeat protein [Gemmatimonadales bacterium]
MLLLPTRAWSQQTGMTRAFDLERRGDYAAAAEAYRSVLTGKPADVSALLGLERVLLPLNRSADILPAVHAALAAAPSSSAVYGIALRAWAAAEQPDSVRSIAERWARVAPTEETPYREWGAAELGRQNRSAARAAYLRGRERLNRPDAMAAEMAQLSLAEADYPTALREWLLAVRRLPGYRATAVSTLAQAPEAAHPELLRLLSRDTDLTARRIEADLRSRWGDPQGGFRVLTAVLPADRIQGIAVLRGFLDQLRTMRSQGARRTEGMVLEAIAARSPELQASRVRLEAAQAYTAAGDQAAARRMLGDLADDRGTPASVASDAATTLIGVLIQEGKLDDATLRLAELRATLSADDYDAIRRGIAFGWMKQGNLGRADSIISADSSVEGLALRGRIHLYQGDVRGAIDLFKEAGPYAGNRAEATHRTTMLALLQPLERDSLPDLGRALLQLEQGDTVQATGGLERVAAELPASHGGAELYLLAGRLSTASGKPAEAERLLRAAAVKEAPSTAPAAELALAELLISARRGAEAVEVLEHLILTYSRSALVPQARRKLDEARGAVPKT